MQNLTPYVCPICASQLPRAAARCFFCEASLPINKGSQSRMRDGRADSSVTRPIEQPRIYLTARDFARLERLAHLDLADGDVAAFTLLRNELSRAVVCLNEEIPQGIVRMGSTVSIRDNDSNGGMQRLHGALVYPGEQHPRLPSIPVSTPLGAAILGLSVGDAMAYSPGDDSRHVVRVLSVHAPVLPPPEPPSGPLAA